MKVNKVLITGVAGFIGSNLLDYLLEHTNWNIDGIDNLSTGHINNVSHQLDNSRFQFSELFCSKLESLIGYNCVFHLAALPRIQPSFEAVSEHIASNLQESIYLIELMIRENYYPRFVFSGSSAIYGNPSIYPTKENNPEASLSPYAFQKYEVEKYLEILATRYPLDYVVLRYFNPYGPRSFNGHNPFSPYSSVVGIFLNRYKEGQPLLVTGNGQQERDFIHVADVARANYLSAIHSGRLNTAMNVGCGKKHAVIEIAKMISNNIEFIDERKGEAKLTLADVSKIKELLNWEPKIKINDYIRNQLKAR